MKLNIKKISIIFGGLLIGLYGLFLVLPYIISPIANSYNDDIEKIIKDTTGLEANLDGIGFTTSYKFDAGLKIKDFSLSAPNSNIKIIDAKNVNADISLIALIFKKVQLGKISADNLSANVVIKKDGTCEILDYIPKSEEPSEPMKSLPFGLKLSNKLPNIIIDNYKLAFIDAQDKKEYSITGQSFKITDFILDKKIKISTNGKITFEDRVVSNYDIKIFNKIMPNLQLDDLVFPKDITVEDNGEITVAPQNMPTKANSNSTPFTIIDAFKTINKNHLKADLSANIQISGTIKKPVQKGYIEINGLSIAVGGKQLPDSFLKMIFKGEKTDFESEFFTSNEKDEKTVLTGSITSGNNKNIDLVLKSNAKFNNIIRLADSVAQTIGKKDLETITATGQFDANFNIKTDLKNVTSNGYLKIAPSKLVYGLYNIVVDNISADIDCKDNNINIKKAGFSIYNQPLNLNGTISQDAVANLKLTANKLPVKGLLGALGQISILKENNINNGTISVNALIKGKLNEIKPDITVNADSIDIYNKPTGFRVLLSNALVKLLLSQDDMSGDIDINSLAIKNPQASISVPKAKVIADTKDINIKNSYVLINNSRVDVTGSVKDYLTDKLNMNIKAQGNLSAKDVMAFIPKEMHWMFPHIGSMPIKLTATGNQKEQKVLFDLNATPQNYIQFADVNLLRNKNTKVHAEMKIANNNIKLSNSGVYANTNQIATFGGGINNLSSPKLNINVSIPKDVSFTIWGMKNSNITANGEVVITGEPLAPKLKGKVNIADLSIKDMNFAITNLVAHLNGNGICGNATAQKMHFDGIVGTNLSSDFSLNNFTDFYLDKITADAFSGKVSGKISYNIPKFAMVVDLTGKGLNSMDAVYGAVKIPRALTGTLNFDTKLSAHGVTDKEIINTMKGDINFNIDNGRFVSIGKLENVVRAQNLTSNSLLKSALSQMTTLSAIQETDKFKTITGKLALSNGTAVMSPVKVEGPLMSYYVTGNYYILPNSAHLNILGRLDSKIVSYLGPIGQLSAEKLLSYIPNFGPATAQYLKLLTSNPETEKTELIPPLTNGSKSYKDFKVIFNGPVEKSSSIKSFKWLSKCDTTQMNIKDDLKNAKEAVEKNIENSIKDAQTKAENMKTNITNIVNTKKQEVENAKKSIQQTKTELENAKNNAKQTATNLGNLLKNAAINSQKKIETTPANKTTTTEQNTTTKTEVKTEQKSAPASSSTQTTTQNATSTSSSTSSSVTTASQTSTSTPTQAPAQTQSPATSETTSDGEN